MKIAFEVGHDAVPKNKRTQEGFTHDWEVYVKGIDGAEIHHYIDKVVFNLHETFPKPKRGTVLQTNSVHHLFLFVSLS